MFQSCLRPISDAVREVQKYSGPEPMQDAKVNPNVYDHVHMKLFRAQRNLYISGFSLFLWLSVIILLSDCLFGRYSQRKAALYQISSLLPT